jgi:hypothetical protein
VNNTNPTRNNGREVTRFVSAKGTSEPMQVQELAPADLDQVAGGMMLLQMLMGQQSE